MSIQQQRVLTAVRIRPRNHSEEGNTIASVDNSNGTVIIIDPVYFGMEREKLTDMNSFERRFAFDHSFDSHGITFVKENLMQ